MKKILCLLLCLASLPASGQLLPAPDAEAVTAAAAAGDTAKLTALLDRGGSVNARNGRGWPPLVCALDAGKPETARVLLARHADVNVTTVKGCAPLDAALVKHVDEMVPPLLDAGAEIHGFRLGWVEGGPSCSALFLALQEHRLEMVRLLLAHGARLEDQNNIGQTALMQSAKFPHADQMALLIERGANVNAHAPDGHTALMYAASNGHDDLVRLLLDKGADIQASVEEESGGPRAGALEHAEKQGHPYVIEMLVEAGAKPAQTKNVLNEELNEALNLGDYERAQAALAKGASATQPDSDHVVPFTVAVLKGDVAAVQMLIKAGSNVNRKEDNDPRTLPLARALDGIKRARTPAEKAQFERVADLLRKAGANQ